MLPHIIAANSLRFFASRRRTANLRASDLDCIALVELGRLSDVLALLPSISLIRSFFPSQHITLAVRKTLLPLLRAIETGVETDAGDSLRSLRPDLVLSMSPHPANVLATLSSGAPFAAGYLRPVRPGPLHETSLTVEAAGFTLPRAMASRGRQSEERALDICRSFGIPVDGVRRTFAMRTAVLEEQRAILAAQEITASPPAVVLHPFSGWEYRSWHLENYADLAARLTEAGDVRVIILGGPENEFVIDPLRARFRGSPDVSVMITPDLLLTATIVHDSAAFGGNDAAPLWLSSVFGVPAVGLFGPTTPALNAPRSKTTVTHYARVACSPCGQRRCAQPGDHCMKQITVDEVFASIGAVLGRRVERASISGVP